MLDALRLEALAAAVADGEAMDWVLAEADLDESQRETVSRLRAIASIGQVFSSLSSDGDRTPPVRVVLGRGDTWGPFHILEHVGRGRYGDVYRAWEPTLDREVALKLIETRVAENTHVVREGRLMARVHHPNVVSIFGAQRIGTVTGLWMQFVRGRTLAADLAAHGPFDADEIVRVGQALCSALGAVHDAGLVHRDVKAQNVLRDERGQILLGDFGTGREMDAGDGGGLAGTPMYVAPELFAGRSPSRQSDIYSLGTLLFHLATSDFPVKGRSLAALRDAHTRTERELLRIRRPDLPPPLVAAIDRTLDPNPAHRFPDAAAFATALAPALPRPTLTRRAITATAALALMTTALVGSVVRSPVATTVPFAARDWVLVTPFENRTGEPVLDGVLEYAVERELTNSAFVNVVSRIRVQDTLELMRKPVDTRLDPDLAREVALRDGQIRLLVAGRIEKLGSRYGLSLQAVNPADGTVVATLDEEARSADDLLRATLAVTSRLRVTLGESLRAVTRSTQTLMKAATPSLRALQLFSAGVDRVDSEVATYDPAGAEELFRQAVVEDPSFATAHAYLATLLDRAAKHDEAIRQAQHALTLADQAPDRERWQIRARAYSVLARLDEPSKRSDHQQQFARMLETHLQFYPDDTDAMRGLAVAYRAVGRSAEAADLTIRLATMRPTSARAQITGARTYVQRGMIDEASALIERAHALGVPPDRLPPGDRAWLLTFAARDAWLRGDPAAAWHELDAAVAAMAPLPSSVREQVELAVVSLYLTLGRLDDADRLLAASLDRVDHDFRLAMVVALRQDQPRLRRLLLDRFAEPEMADRVGSLWSDAGLLDTARAVVARQPTNDLYAGQLALVESRFEDAIAALSRMNVPRQFGGAGRWRAARKLAEALRRAGRVQEALHVLERAYPERWTSEGGHSGGYEWLRLADALAQLYRQIGRLDAATSVEAELRRLLAVADEDHPVKRRLQR